MVARDPLGFAPAARYAVPEFGVDPLRFKHTVTWRRLLTGGAVAVLAGGSPSFGQAGQHANANTVGSQSVDWPTPSGDPGAMRYSPLADVNRNNVARLQVAWSWKTGERNVPTGPDQKPSHPGMFEASPVVIGDTMYVPTPYAAVAALNSRTGKELWRYDPKVWRAGQPSNGTGFVHRGLGTWSDGSSRRIFINARWKLIALDARTGKPIPSFGESGVVDLVRNLRRPVNKLHYTNTSPPVVYGDLVIVGNSVGDRLRYRNDPPGDVQAFDVRTGKRVWSFHTVPDSGEFGWKTWENGSYKYMGHTNVWAPMSVDAKRGLLFLPVSTPTNDWYGGDRKGDDLFAESVVAVNARTGKRVWHYQLVHHGLWDYDLPAPPVLATITWNGKPRDVVAVPSKTAWIYVFDRVTGAPIWPITERPVPQSDVPGERTSPTQPFPSNPGPFTRQTVTENDLIDFTPELNRRAREVFKKYRSGPIFTPPSMQGTITMPGAIGGAGWGSTSYDPESHTLYVKGTNDPALYQIKKGVPNDTIGYDYTADLVHSGLGVTPDAGGGRELHTASEQLPLIKPPYGNMTAIDLNTGKQRWQVTLGDTPEIRNNPLLKGVKLPPLGVAGAVGGTVTKGGLIFATGGGDVLYALDTSDGRVLWQHTLPAGRGYANPISYRGTNGIQYVVIASGGGENAELVAFSLNGAH